MTTEREEPLRTIPYPEISKDPKLYIEVGAVLEQGGLVCVPTPSGYKLLADLASPKAVTAMLQAKRRVKNAPSLVFVPSAEWVERVVDSVSDEARRLMRELWPGPVTLLFKAGERIDPKLRKPLTKAKGWLGLRMPDDEVSRGALAAFGRPVLVSSANLADKGGAHSVAQVKKNFGRTVDLLVDKGDLAPAPSSTLVDVSEGAVKVVRTGAVGEERVSQILEA
jgi:tRNA threonylcarbamoyl adenosine modification protein (Sua5/YciO/YrdC/YwlC family)